MTLKAGARTTRVLIVTRSAERRRALRAKLAEEPDLELTDIPAAELDTAASPAWPGTVAVVDMDGGHSDAAARLVERGTALVLLTDHPEAGGAAQMLAGEAKALLRRDCSGQQLGAAVLAAAAGLTVLEADTLQGLLQPPLESAELEPGEEELTPRENEVLRMMTAGLSNREIASVLGISEHTVKFHITSIFGKLGTSSRTEAVTEGIRRGLILL